MDLNDLQSRAGEWLCGSGPESDIVISSRIRLARNVADYPFLSRASPKERTQLERILREKIEDDPGYPVRLQTVRGVGYRFQAEASPGVPPETAEFMATPPGRHAFANAPDAPPLGSKAGQRGTGSKPSGLADAEIHQR